MNEGSILAWDHIRVNENHIKVYKIKSSFRNTLFWWLKKKWLKKGITEIIVWLELGL